MTKHSRLKATEIRCPRIARFLQNVGHLPFTVRRQSGNHASVWSATITRPDASGGRYEWRTPCDNHGRGLSASDHERTLQRPGTTEVLPGLRRREAHRPDR